MRTLHHFHVAMDRYPENDSDVMDIEPEYSNRASRRDALSVTEDDPDDDPEENDDEDSELDEDDLELDERSLSDNTACAASPAQLAQPARQAESQESPPRSSTGRGATATACAGLPRTSRGSPAQDSAHSAAPESTPAPQSGAKQYSNPASRSDSTACAASPAQDSGHDAAAVDDSDEPDNDPDAELEELEDEVLEEHAIAYAASLAQAVEKLTAGSNHRGRTATATARAGLPRTSRGSPAQAIPRNELRGRNPQNRSKSDRTARAANPQSRSVSDPHSLCRY